MFKVNRVCILRLAISGAMASAMALSLAAKADAYSEEAQSEQQFMADQNLVDVDMSSAGSAQSASASQPTYDLAHGVKWLGLKIGHGAKKTVSFSYNHGVKQTGAALALVGTDVEKGTVFVVVETSKGVANVSKVIVKGGDVAVTETYKHALKPYIVRPAVALAETGGDAVYGMVLVPAGHLVRDTANADVVTGVKSAGTSMAAGTKKTGNDISQDSQGVYTAVIYPLYDKALKPVGHASSVAAKATYTAVTQ